MGSGVYSYQHSLVYRQVYTKDETFISSDETTVPFVLNDVWCMPGKQYTELPRHRPDLGYVFQSLYKLYFVSAIYLQL